MSKYDFTPAAKILTVATVFVFASFLVTLFFEHTGFFALFLGGTTLCLLGATYGAATDMSYASLYEIDSGMPESPRARWLSHSV